MATQRCEHGCGLRQVRIADDSTGVCDHCGNQLNADGAQKAWTCSRLFDSHNFDLLVKGYVKATGRVDSAATKKDLNKYLRYLQRASSTNKGSRASAAAASKNK